VIGTPQAHVLCGLTWYAATARKVPAAASLAAPECSTASRGAPGEAECGKSRRCPHTQVARKETGHA